MGSAAACEDHHPYRQQDQDDDLRAAIEEFAPLLPLLGRSAVFSSWR
jgi:hypothetical protein